MHCHAHLAWLSVPMTILLHKSIMIKTVSTGTQQQTYVTMWKFLTVPHHPNFLLMPLHDSVIIMRDQG